MSNPYILRKGVSSLGDLTDGVGAKGDPAAGKVLFVNGVSWANGFTAGNDANSGESLDDPLYTIAKAISLCTNEGNDYIYILDYWQNDTTWPISVNVDGLSIIGVNWRPMRPWPVLSSSGNYACFDIVASTIYIEGLALYPTAGYAGMTFDDGVKNVWINKCAFQQGSYGIQLSAGDMSTGLAITNCHFMATLSSGGIYINDDPAFCTIDGNMFDQLTGDSIAIVQGGGHVITNNMFAMKAATSGLSITLSTAVSRAFVNGNHSAYGANNSSISPYDDEGTVTTNNWGTNFYGSAVADPA